MQNPFLTRIVPYWTRGATRFLSTWSAKMTVCVYLWWIISLCPKVITVSSATLTKTRNKPQLWLGEKLHGEGERIFFFYLRFHHNIARMQGHLYPKGATVIKILIYHINYGVMQGFVALTKAATNVFFDNANQLLRRHSPFALLGQVDKWTAKPSRFSIQGMSRKFLGLWRLKHWKIRPAYRQWRSNFPRRENQYTKRKT